MTDRLPILVVEDNDTEKFALQALLAQFDYNAICVSSGEDALSYLDSSDVAAILLDLTLPGMDGFECARKIREKSATLTIPIIALTGRTDERAQSLAFAVGMTSFLSKPFDIEELRRILLRHVYDPELPNLKTLTPVVTQTQSLKCALEDTIDD